MKKILFLFLFFTIVFLLFISCAGAPPTPIITGNGQGNITVMAAATNAFFNVFIDGQKQKDEIFPNKSVNFSVPNGKHYITASGSVPTAGGWKLTPLESSESIEINVNNDSHIFSAKAEKQGTPPKWVAILTKAAAVPEKKSVTETAINNVFEDLSPGLPAKSKIAVVNISSSNSSEGEFVCEELTLLFVRANKYSIVDRRSLDAIKKEQNFHMTGEVDDNSVVSIGQLLGAEVVITGAITGEGYTKRLRVKALDVKTGQIRAMSSQSI